MKKLLAYHDDPAIKEKYIVQVGYHRAADELVKGVYWEKGKGCAVGCTIYSSRHADYETLLGVPQMLARLEDAIFEGLPNADAQAWPEAFLEAIPVGADLSLVGWQFLSWVVGTTLDEFADVETREKCAPARDVARRKAEGLTISYTANAAVNTANAAVNTANAAANAANAAAASTAAATAAATAAYTGNAATAYAAYTAATAAGNAAAYAAHAATANANAADAAAARETFYQRMATRLLELIEVAPCGVEGNEVKE